jgi:hypothetical protein
LLALPQTLAAMNPVVSPSNASANAASFIVPRKWKNSSQLPRNPPGMPAVPLSCIKREHRFVLLKFFPDRVWKSEGHVLHIHDLTWLQRAYYDAVRYQRHCIDDALKSYERALLIDPDNADT